MVSLINFLEPIENNPEMLTDSFDFFSVIIDSVFSPHSRFGSLMEVYLVPGRNVGYIKYSDRKPAHDAIALLHGKVVNGVKMKVMLADPPKEESHKRQRTY